MQVHGNNRRGPYRALKIGGGLVAVVVLIAGIGVGGFAARNLYAGLWRLRAARRAGFVERQTMVNGVRLNYAEGPANGKPELLLIPGQGSDWKSYAAVLPELAKGFHVFAVDVHGHGASQHTPERYRAVAIGEDLRQFLVQVVQRPAIVSGHSSGGQLAAWLAAYAPDRVRAVLLEDPPMLTTLLPRARNTWNWRDLAATCHEFLAEHPDANGDFVAYSWEHQLMWKYFGDSADSLRRQGVRYRAEHPGQPLRLWWWPGNDYLRSLDSYDPRFGEAFYTDSWDTGFDHEATLRAIRQPTTFVHTKVDYDGEILRGATDDNDARLISDLLPNDRLVQVKTGHDFHNEDARRFVELVGELARRA